MIYETYTCAGADSKTEYGYCFKEQAGDDDCALPDLVLGLVSANDPDPAGQIGDGWVRWAWMAEAVCEAANKRGL